LDVKSAAAKLDKLNSERLRRGKESDEFKGFFLGEQPLKFASNEWAEEHQARYEGFADNWTEVVANSNAERITLDGVKIPTSSNKASAKQTPQERKLMDMFLSLNFDSLSQQGFLESIISRRSFAYVWNGEDGEGSVGDWKDPSEAIVEYDPFTGRDRRFGAMFWDDETRLHAHLYTKTEVFHFSREKGVVSSGGLILPSNVSLPGQWEFHEDTSGVNHLGVVPLVEFPNRPILKKGPLSDISGVMAMQEAINLLWAYLFSAADFAGMPARVIMGQAPPKIPILDENGVKVGERTVDPIELTRGRMLWLTGQNATIGQWESAKLDVFTAVIEQAVGHIAAQTRTPPHYLVANKGLSNLSGDALKAAETGLVSKVRQTISYFEPSVRALFVLIALQSGDKRLAEAAKRSKPQWKDVENRSEAQASDALLKKQQAGYPFEWLLREDGKSPDEISEIMAMKEAESQRALAAGVADLIRAPMQNGQQPDEGDQE
jgi:hypothetical protein